VTLDVTDVAVTAGAVEVVLGCLIEADSIISPEKQPLLIKDTTAAQRLMISDFLDWQMPRSIRWQGIDALQRCAVAHSTMRQRRADDQRKAMLDAGLKRVRTASGRIGATYHSRQAWWVCTHAEGFLSPPRRRGSSDQARVPVFVRMTGLGVVRGPAGWHPPYDFAGGAGFRMPQIG
jgi:hypothetical protein